MYVFLFSKIVLKTSRKRGCGVFPASVAGHAGSRVGWGRGRCWVTENRDS